ncbi:uncharacterized protein LOC122398327 [Colletes gigas]|uniref:uncharacterized protein LOC122398327 n=1 Tax=Colletes gigas TaxID=935657 RepID=UPI001C9A3F51|nr:uncharacterized protein LOC122398327 [Colletes gigas]
MPRSEHFSSRDTLDTVTTTEEQRRTGRYIAGGALLAVTLLALHHVLLRDTSTITGVCIPLIIMVSYIVWILYSAHRDRRKALRFATAMQLTEVISVPATSDDAINKNDTSSNERRKAQESRENHAFSSKDECS